MSVRRRLFLTLTVLVFLGFFGLAHWIHGELRRSYAQIVEEMLVDEAQFLAAEIETKSLSNMTLEGVRQAFTRYQHHSYSAKILGYEKSSSAMDFYIFSEQGRILFSTRSKDIGRDFSSWNDVYNTLRGKYGARSTRVDPQDRRTSVHYVAAPITINSKVVGGVTVWRSEGNTLVFLDQAVQRMFIGGLLAVLALIAFAGLLVIWITWPLESLRRYALGISEGQRIARPSFRIREIADLGNAFEKMRVSLEGKKTVEKYSQLLTHELKSPLTAIQGAAELCLEGMEPEQKTKFLKNIVSEAVRSQKLLESLLAIAALEARSGLETQEMVDVADLLDEVRESLTGAWSQRGLKINTATHGPTATIGDRFLLFQALRNIMQNAIEFSYTGGEIDVTTLGSDTTVAVTVRDRGVGIPPYAYDRIFDKFFSLERPQTGKRSSGLGLAFVKEVLDLHSGGISVLSNPTKDPGTTVVISLLAATTEPLPGS